jgi:hypothetical protein
LQHCLNKIRIFTEKKLAAIKTYFEIEYHTINAKYSQRLETNPQKKTSQTETESTEDKGKKRLLVKDKKFEGKIKSERNKVDSFLSFM